MISDQTTGLSRVHHIVFKELVVTLTTKEPSVFGRVIDHVGTETAWAPDQCLL